MRPGRHRRRRRTRSTRLTLAAAVALLVVVTGAVADWDDPSTGVVGATLRGLEETTGAPSAVPGRVSAAPGRPDTPAEIAEATRAPQAGDRRVSSGRRPRDDIPLRGPGVFDVVAPRGPAGTAGAMSYTVEIERSLPFSERRVREVVSDTLADPRGWTGVLDVTLAQVAADPDLRVLMASPATTDRLCAPLLTRGRVSCRNGPLVVINALRWADGIPDYRGDLLDYRRYVVNHEVGHALGQVHQTCPGAGQPAPVMQQQTYGLEGCLRNPWPQTG